MRQRPLYVGRRPRRRGPGGPLLLGIAGLLLVGALYGSFTLISGVGSRLIAPLLPTPTATPMPPPTSTPVPMVTGQVTNAFTGAPLAGATVALGEQSVVSDGGGRFRLTSPSVAGEMRVTAPAFEPITRPVRAQQSETVHLALRPNSLEGIVRNAGGEPLAAATVTVGPATATTGADGRFTLKDLPVGAELTVEAPDHARFREPVGQRVSIEVRLRTNTVTGLVKSKDGKPLIRATVALGERATVTGADGRFRLTEVPEGGTLAVKAGGFIPDRRQVQPGATVEITLTPLVVKGIYLTHLTASQDKRFDELLALIKRTELNAMVLDVKGESGHVFYDSKVPLAREIGAVEPAYDIRKRLRQLREANVYAIARVVIMEDTLLATSKPELAIRNKATGKPWRDFNGIAWLNPYRSEVWDYNIAIAKEVAELGFDEIQYDYVRFPSDGPLDQVDYGRPSTEESRTAAISSFLTRSRAALDPLGVFLAADLFGLTTLASDDMGIGQFIERVNDAVDYICPMVYPSHYSRGNFGYANPAAYPYEVVLESLKAGRPKLGQGRAQFRPWLQDFDLNNTPYTPAMVRAQIRASEEQGTAGWLLWNAANKYQEAALRPRS